jgi:hypothetical protein
MPSLQNPQIKAAQASSRSYLPELNIKILDQLSLEDMRHLIMASPAVLQSFRRHRSYVVRHHLQGLLQFYLNESMLPLVAFTMCLRLLRSQCQQQTASEVEEILKPWLNAVLLLECTRSPAAGDLNLPMLNIALNLVPELFNSFKLYQNERAYL